MNAASQRLDDRVSPRLPGAGPIMLTIPGVSDVAINAATLGPEVFFRWPGPWLVSAFWLGEQNTATAAAIANLRLRMVDSNRQELAIDGQGLINNLGGLAGGISPRWIPFRRVIRPGQKWLFQIQNRNAFTAIPQLYFKLEEQ